MINRGMLFMKLKVGKKSLNSYFLILVFVLMEQCFYLINTNTFRIIFLNYAMLWFLFFVGGIALLYIQYLDYNIETSCINYRIQDRKREFNLYKVFLDTFAAEIGNDLRKVELIEALLFLSMIPLHGESIRHQMVMLGTGLEILNRVVNIQVEGEESRNYSKKNRPLPVLSVVEDGILRGYVPFDKDWTGFSAEEYREASESVMKEPDVTVTADVKKRLDLTGYEIVRVQYFSTMQNPAMTISNGRLRFNTACLKKFENVEYVELLLNSVERCIAIRPCDKNNPNAIRWGRLKEGRWCASTLGCRGLAKTLFDIMEWDEDLRYRFRGQFLEQGDNKMMLFAFDEPEMIKVEEIVLPPKENTEEDEGETVKKKIYIFPPEWAGTFGQPITSIAQVGILRQEHYAGNWDVFRPATEIEEMNIFTAESLNELLREAEKIMEGWTDYR